MIKKLGIEDFNGIDIDRSLLPEKYYLDKVNSREGLYERLKLAYDDLIRAEYNVTTKKDESIDYQAVFFRSMNRTDYKALFHKITDQCEYDKIKVIEDFVKPTDRINIDVSRFVTDNQHFMHLINEDNKLKKIILFLKFCKALLILEKLKRIDFQVLVVFSDMQLLDNVLVAFFKKNGKKTVTMQHGLYVDYKDFDNVNSVNYLNHCSDYFLAWGECTGKLIKEYHPYSKVRICGKPDFTLAETSNGSRNVLENYCLVILDQELFGAENFHMLSIVKRFADKHKINIGVKFHPQNPKDQYLKKLPWIKESNDIKNCLFVVGHTSSLLFESVVRGKVAFRYKTKAPCLTFYSDYEFSDLKGLFKAYKNNNKENIDGSFYVAKKEVESERAYQRFFRDLCGPINE